MLIVALIIIIVALFTRAWIEMPPYKLLSTLKLVALFTRAWIEILISAGISPAVKSRPLYEGVD